MNRDDFMSLSVVIPARNEEAAIGTVLRDVPAGVVEVIVVDNGSTDATAAVAFAAGAKVVSVPEAGYGRACAAGAREADTASSILVFLDGDGSDCAAGIPRLVAPIDEGTYDFVIGSRVRGEREAGSMELSQLLAAAIASRILKLLYGISYTDMCPFRAIRRDAFEALHMQEATYGWNVEMQMRAAHAGLRILEIPVPHHRRKGGRSKVSGSPLNALRAAYRILVTIAHIAWETRRPVLRRERAST